MEQRTGREALARNLRRLRVARRWSLADLASATGAGKATLSAIENGRANPTVDTLSSLARALEVDLAALFETGDTGEVTIVRAGGGEPAGEARERAARIAGGGELQRASLPPRTELRLAPLSAGARVHVLVTLGTVVAGPVERVSELGPGDCMSFTADRPHVLTTAARRAEAVIVIERGSG